MEEIELTKKDLRIITESARKIYLEESIKPSVEARNFLAYCYAKAIKSYCKGKNWIIVDGKILNKEEYHKET